VRQHVPWRGQSATRADSKALAAVLRELRLDLAHFHFGGTFGWGSRMPDFAAPIHFHRLGGRCLATNHGVFDLFDGYIGAQRSVLTKLALLPLAWASRMQLISHLSAEVAVSMNDYRALRCRYWPLREKFRQIYHSQLHEPPPCPLERIKSIICIGTIGPRKGQTYLTEAFCRIATRHPDWNLVLIGRGGDPDMMRRIHSLRDEHGLRDRIVLLGNQSDAEVNGWYRRAAIFVMPSVAEGLGLSLQEALFNGCACVATRAGGMQDLIQHEDNGLMVPPTDVNELARAMERLILDEPLRRRVALRGPKSVLEKGMTAERMVQKYETLYAECLNQPRPAG
jgi:glycosyltransferase involved in cell wall biosynthesis